jgi:PII-like signaling protein
MIPTDARLLRIYVDAHERWEGRPRYEAIVARARAAEVAGASVFPVEMSYGSHRHIHDAASDYGFLELPVVIELVDAPERIAALLDELGPMIAGVEATVQPVRVVRYAHSDPGATPC